MNNTGLTQSYAFKIAFTLTITSLKFIVKFCFEQRNVSKVKRLR